MKTNKNTVKTIMHFCSNTLVFIIAILSIVNLFLPRFKSINSLQFDMVVITSSLNLCFSLIFIVIGNFIPKEERVLTSKETRNLFLIQKLGAIMNGHIAEAIHTKKLKKSIRRQWNAPAILISSIFLLFMNFFTAVFVAGIKDFQLSAMIDDLNSSLYSKLLMTQFIAMILLIITSFVWYFIDLKSRVQVPEDIKYQKQGDVKQTKVQCAHCGNVIIYERYNGICPKCGKYNQLSNAYSNENTYKSKKTALQLIKTIITIILIFAFIIIAAYIKEFKL